MVTMKTVTYECETCGTELVVKESGEGYLSPIYCCGTEIKEIATSGKKSVPKKVRKKKSTAKKKPASPQDPAEKRSKK